MIEHTGSRADRLSRRAFLGVTATTVGAWVVGGATGAQPGPPLRRRRAEDLLALSVADRLHFPLVRLPVVTENGDRVPITIEMTHPMDPDHHITQVTVVNERDPVPLKGEFKLTPASGQVYLAFQARLDAGPSEIAVTAECSRHGAWTTLAPVAVADGRGGCAAAAPPGRRPASEVLPPRLRIPRHLHGSRIRPGDVIDVQLSMRHPNRTGLTLRDGKFVQESEPFHLQELIAFYDDARVSRFVFTSALSDDPLIGFRVRAGRGGVVRAALTNSRGERFEARAPVEVDRA